MSNVKLVICIENANYPTSLELRRVYETVSDRDAEKHGLIRIIDESGEDYLYPERCFVHADLPEDIRAAIVEAA